ncbi:MAG: hypothetical protein ACLFV3_02010 [Phycisphaeraceae bacterium]
MPSLHAEPPAPPSVATCCWCTCPTLGGRGGADQGRVRGFYTEHIRHRFFPLSTLSAAWEGPPNHYSQDTSQQVDASNQDKYPECSPPPRGYCENDPIRRVEYE